VIDRWGRREPTRAEELLLLPRRSNYWFRPPRRASVCEISESAGAVSWRLVAQGIGLNLLVTNMFATASRALRQRDPAFRACAEMLRSDLFTVFGRQDPAASIYSRSKQDLGE